MKLQCPQCNKINGKNYRFCSNCGTLLNSFNISQKTKTNNVSAIAIASLVSIVFACGVCGLFGAISEKDKENKFSTNKSNIEKPTAKPKPSIRTLIQGEKKELKENKPESKQKKNTSENQPRKNKKQFPAKNKSEQKQPRINKRKISPKTRRNTRRRSGLIRDPKGGCYYINKNGNKTYVDRSMCN